MDILYSAKAAEQLKSIARGDKKDYYSALKVKKENKKWIKHEFLKKKLGLK